MKSEKIIYKKAVAFHFLWQKFGYPVKYSVEETFRTHEVSDTELGLTGTSDVRAGHTTSTTGTTTTSTDTTTTSTDTTTSTTDIEANH